MLLHVALQALIPDSHHTESNLVAVDHRGRGALAQPLPVFGGSLILSTWTQFVRTSLSFVHGTDKKTRVWV